MGKGPGRPALAWLDGYFAATRRPIYSIFVSAPFFAAYELAMAFIYDKLPLGERRSNLAEMILHAPESVVGRQAAYLLPVIAGMALLFILHWRERAAGRTPSAAAPPPPFRPRYLPWMVLEALVLALPLPFLLGTLRERGLSAASGDAGAGAGRSLLFDLGLACGAGAYEELLFRLFLFTGLYWLGLVMGIRKLPAWLVAAAVSSLIFALVHFQPLTAQPFDPAFFVFAALAGFYLAVICHFRSFGMAVATHAVYDIMAALLLRG